MNETEWRQAREFIWYHSERSVFSGYGFLPTQIRNLDTGRKIRTVALVALPHPTAWSASDARRYFGITKEYIDLVKVARACPK